MNKAKLIEAHELAIKAHEMAIEAIKEDMVVADAETKAESKAVEKKTAKVASKPAEKPVEKEETELVDSSSVTAEDVAEMSYNELKKFAQSIGIKAVGTRDQIRAKVLEAISGGAVDAEEPKEEKPAKSAKKNNVVSMEEKKGSLKKKKEEPAEEEMDDVEKAVRAEAEEMDVTDIAELLQSVGVKASGNKAKLTDALVKAVKDGKLDFSDDDEADEEVEAEEVDAEDDGEEPDFYEYHKDFDFAGVNDPDAMSKKRSKAIKKMIDKELASIESGDTTEKDVKDFLETILTEDELEEHPLDSMDETDLMYLYFEVMKATVDDDGDVHEPADPYVVGETNLCCGHELVYDEESEQYICVQ